MLSLKQEARGSEIAWEPWAVRALTLHQWSISGVGLLPWITLNLHHKLSECWVSRALCPQPRVRGKRWTWRAQIPPVPTHSSQSCSAPSASLSSEVSIQHKVLQERENVFIEAVLIVRKSDTAANPEKDLKETLEML